MKPKEKLVLVAEERKVKRRKMVGPEVGERFLASMSWGIPLQGYRSSKGSDVSSAASSSKCLSSEQEVCNLVARWEEELNATKRLPEE